MSLSCEEIEIIIEEIMDKFEARLMQEICEANRKGNLEEVLKKYDVEDKINKSFDFDDRAKIMLIGQIELNDRELKGLINSTGLKYENFEIYKDYTRLPQINFIEKLHWQSNYSDVLVCAMPHSMAGVSTNSSLISMIENHQDEYPKLTRITNEAGELKFTKSAFKKAIENTKLYKKKVLGKEE